MNRNLFWKVSLIAVGFALLNLATAFSMDKKTTEKLRLMKIQTATYAIPADSRAHPTSSLPISQGTVGRYIGATSGASSLGCSPGAEPDPARGLTVGCTFYDYQRNGNTDRQISTAGPDHIINFNWMNQDNNSATGGRNVRFEAYDPSTGALGDGTGGVDIGGDLIPPNRSGYTVMDAADDGTAVNAHHWNTNFGGAGSRYKTNSFKNQTPTLGDFVGGEIDIIIYDTLSLFVAGDQNIWPRVAYTSAGANSVTHVLAATDNSSAYLTYTRRVGVAGAWEPAIIFGWSGLLAYGVTASHTSGDVAIYWCGGRGDKTANNCSIDRSNGLLSGAWDNDVYYMKSTDGGANFAACENVTLRDPDVGFAPNIHVTGLFDLAGDLHLAWNAAQWPSPGQAFGFRSRIFHWDENSAAVRTVHDAVWNPTTCNGGAFQLNESNTQLTQCDDKLYITFTLYAPVPIGRDDDCGARASTAPGGAANGDLWVTVSENGGFNWDPARNLTDTYTPGCDTVPGGVNPDCDSDAWPTAIRYGIDVSGQDFAAIPDLTDNIDNSYAGTNFVVVQYISDGDPGGAIQGQGGWTDNKVMAIRYGCVEIVPAAVLASSIPAGQAIDDPAHTLPGFDSTITWRLENTGNSPLTYTLNIVAASPTGNVSVAGASGNISAGAVNFEDLELILNVNKLTDQQNASATIVIDGNFTTAPDTFQIDYAIADIQLLVLDTLESFLVLANNGNIGNSGQDSVSMDFQGDPAECEDEATEYLFDGSPIISYGGLVVTSMFNSGIVDSTIFRPLTPPTVDVDGQYEHSNSGDFITQDSTIMATVDMWTPAGNLTGISDAWKAVIVRVKVQNIGGSPIDSVFVAYGWDWDVPADNAVNNTSAISANVGVEPYLYQQGTDDTTLDTLGCMPNLTRYAAVIYTPDAAAGEDEYTDGGNGDMGTGFQSLYTRDNATFLSAGGWAHTLLDSMLHNNSGFNIFTSPDPLLQEVDLHMVLNGGANRLDPDDVLILWFRMLTGFGTQSDFEDAATETIALANPGTCCLLAGDANNDTRTNIADVTFLIARIFAGGSAPPCCEQGDANGDGRVNIADVTFLIARIFAGGTAPICGPPGIGC